VQRRSRRAVGRWLDSPSPAAGLRRRWDGRRERALSEHTALGHLLISAGVTVAALFPIIDPIGNVPVFLALTRDMDPAERRRQALLATFWAVGILVVFLFFGRFVLDFFDVSLAAIEAVGGLVLGYMGWEMVTKGITVPEVDDEVANEIYFTPIAFPMLAGPGAIALLFGLGNRADSGFDYPGYVIGIIGIAIVAYIGMRNADRLLRLLGPHGIEVFNRLMGLIVLAIAAELLFHGIEDHFGIQVPEGGLRF
jgi:multiple antibiotic resistance protein